jgi:hypothetical protein
MIDMQADKSANPPATKSLDFQKFQQIMKKWNFCNIIEEITRNQAD